MKIDKLAGERFKEKPSDCVIDSHALMLRGGYMKGVANGIYFLISGMFFLANNGAFQGAEYLLLHSFPSAVYSALFIIPFYFIGKLIKKI